MTPHPSGGGRRRRRPSGSSSSAGPRREHVPELHPVEEPPDVQTFAEWPLGEDIQRGIAAMDIVKPTPIQALSIGPVLEGRDVIAKAQTGTGKTLAFGAPMMSKIDAARATVLGLVLCPTRELAQQVHGVLATLGLPRGVRVAMCVGGDPIHPQIADLKAGAQVVVGTPGRVLDLYQQRFLSFPWTEFVVLDEADKMFEIGFIDDIKKILSFTPEERQTLLFSATFPTEVLKLARESTRNPLEVATAAGTVTVDTVDQCFMQLDEGDRPMALVRLLEQSGEKDVFLVFCGRRTEVDRLMRSLERASLSIKALHGGYDQAARFRVMSAFRTGEVKALIATDVASRGLDVQHVTHVVNYDVPRDAEDYTHRIGRTGRAGRSGIAITFVCPHDGRKWREILARTKASVTELEPPRRTGSRPSRPARAERDERAEPAERPRREASAPRRAREERPERPPAEERPPRSARPERARRDEPREPAGREPAAPVAPADEPRTGRRRRGGRGRGRQEGGATRPAEERAPEARRGSTEEPRTDTATRPRAVHARRGDAAPQAGPRIEDRSPDPGPRRRRRRRPGAHKPEADPRDPDGLGRWGNRAEDFD
ncbi:MAG TPA: DEAD/DEAH box helicase [Planctomycetota bacterium]